MSIKGYYAGKDTIVITPPDEDSATVYVPTSFLKFPMKIYGKEIKPSPSVPMIDGQYMFSKAIRGYEYSIFLQKMEKAGYECSRRQINSDDVISHKEPDGNVVWIGTRNSTGCYVTTKQPYVSLLSGLFQKGK
jgi:hypothetical protein